MLKDPVAVVSDRLLARLRSRFLDDDALLAQVTQVGQLAKISSTV